MMQEKRKVSAEIKTYIGGILLNQEPYNGPDAEKYQAWRTAASKRYSLANPTPEEAIPLAVYNRGMKEEFKADRSIWTAFCCASVSLHRTRQLDKLLLERQKNGVKFNEIYHGNSMTVEEIELFNPHLSLYQNEDMTIAIGTSTAYESWFPMVIHFEREIERNTVNYLQHIIAQLRDVYGEIPFPNSPREAVMIMKQKLNMQ